jgi:hypothetical protein
MSRSRRRAQELDTQVAGTTDLLRQLLQCVRALACRAAGSGFLVRAKEARRRLVRAGPGGSGSPYGPTKGRAKGGQIHYLEVTVRWSERGLPRDRCKMRSPMRCSISRMKGLGAGQLVAVHAVANEFQFVVLNALFDELAISSPAPLLCGRQGHKARMRIKGAPSGQPSISG